jgi:hypothetical protein
MPAALNPLKLSYKRFFGWDSEILVNLSAKVMEIQPMGKDRHLV